MAGLDLRPLSLGEILDRSFSLYRRHFLLFFGISAIPRVPVLAISLLQLEIGYTQGPTSSISSSLMTVLLSLMLLAATLVAYLFSQGGTILAVSELYLGRPASIAESLKRVWSEIGFLLGVSMLSGLATVAGLICLVIPGIYIMCRLVACVPVALIEQRPPAESLRRSFELTKGFAGRGFVILLLAIVLTIAAQLLFTFPFLFAVGATANDPAMLRIWQAITQISSSLAAVLITPIFLTATSVYYYDLRVRKEAFDLQLMLNPDTHIAGPSSVPSILS